MDNSNTVDNIKPNKWCKGIENYVALPLIALTSLPAAGIYLAKRKRIGKPLKNVMMGVCLSTVLSLGTFLYQTRDISEHKLGRINIECNYEYVNNPSNLEITKSIALVLSTNYSSFEMIRNPPKSKITTVTANTKDGEDDIECKYKIKSCPSISELSNSEFPEPELIYFRGDNIITGDTGKKAYSGLCKKAIEEELGKF